MVHRDGPVKVDRATTRRRRNTCAREIWVRWDSRLVRIFNDRMEQIALHSKQELSRFSTPKQFIASEKISGDQRQLHFPLTTISIPHRRRLIFHW